MKGGRKYTSEYQRGVADERERWRQEEVKPLITELVRLRNILIVNEGILADVQTLLAAFKKI